MTVDEFAEIVKSKLEDEETPARVLTWAEKNQGKQLRSNNLPEGFRLDRRYSFTVSLRLIKETEEKYATFTLTRWQGANVVPTPAKLREMNPAYYSGLEERNAYRRESLADRDRMSDKVVAIELVQTAVAAYRLAQKYLEEVAGYPDPDSYTWQDLAGVIKEEYKR